MAAKGIGFDINHFAVVPSTRGKPPPHPLARLLNLEKLVVDIAVSRKQDDRREFDENWFHGCCRCPDWTLSQGCVATERAADWRD